MWGAAAGSRQNVRLAIAIDIPGGHEHSTGQVLIGEGEEGLHHREGGWIDAGNIQHKRVAGVFGGADNDIRLAVTREISRGNVDAPLVPAAKGHERFQNGQVLTAEHLDMVASGKGGGHDIHYAIAIHIPGGHAHSTVEVLGIRQEAEYLRPGASIKHLNGRSGPGSRGDHNFGDTVIV